MSLAGDEARAFSGHEGMGQVWAESRANWARFEFDVVGASGDVVQVAFAGNDTLERSEVHGMLWFRAETRDGLIVRLWSALDPGRLPTT